MLGATDRWGNREKQRMRDRACAEADLAHYATAHAGEPGNLDIAQWCMDAAADLLAASFGHESWLTHFQMFRTWARIVEKLEPVDPLDEQIRQEVAAW